MEKAGVPVVPGYHGERQEPKFLKQKAYEIGYPVLIKAVAGGGGKGMRRVDRHADFDAALERAPARGESRLRRCARADREICRRAAPHRDAGVRRPPRQCHPSQRARLLAAAPPSEGDRGGAGAGHERRACARRWARPRSPPRRPSAMSAPAPSSSSPTASAGCSADGFWFMEMNTRLQVEHPVTEAITGLDLVEWQFRVAAGEKLPLTQEQVPLDGHAVEARLYAEDPERGFLPSTGTLLALQFPQGEGVRVDTGVEAGGEITPFYDPMIAKLIAHGANRDAGARPARRCARPHRRRRPAQQCRLPGRALPRAPSSAPGNFDTGFIDRNLAELGAAPQGLDRAAAALGAQKLLDARARAHRARRRARAGCSRPRRGTPATASSSPARAAWRCRSWSTARASWRRSTYGADGADGRRRWRRARGAMRSRSTAGDAVYVLRQGRQTRSRLRDLALDEAGDHGARRACARADARQGAGVLVEQGERVTRGQRLAIIEAMKMEHTLIAPIDGAVAEIAVAAGRQVAEGAKVMVIERRTSSWKSANAASSHQALRRLQLGRRSRGLDQAEARREEEARPEARAHPHHPHGAQARRGTPRRRLALLGDPRPDHAAASASSTSARSPTKTASAAAAWCSTANACWSSRGRARPSRAGAISRPRTRRAICRARRPAPPRCRSRCGANCASWGCCRHRNKNLSPLPPAHLYSSCLIQRGRSHEASCWRDRMRRPRGGDERSSPSWAAPGYRSRAL